MRRRIYLVILILFSASSVGAQEISRAQKIEELKKVSSQAEQIRTKLNELENRRETISEELLAVSSQDIAEAEKVGAEAERLFPAGLLKGLYSTAFEDSWDYSSHVLTPASPYYLAARIEYQNNWLEFNNSANVFGFIVNLGGTLMETINEQNREFIALAKYEDFKNIENEFSFDGINFRKKVPVVVGNTYLVRAINKGGGDGILAVKIHRKDSDASIVLFIKKIKNFSRDFYRSDFGTDNIKRATEEFSGEMNRSNSQTSPPVADYAAQQAVTDALYRKGFYSVAVDATTTEITLRGTVPKGKSAEAVRLAHETAKRKVNNQLSEQ